MRQKLTKEMVNDRIDHRGLTMVGDYVDSRTKSEFKCEHGHSWMAPPNKVMRGSGCPECVLRNATLTKEMVNDRIDHRGLTMVGDYVTNKTKSQFKCKHGHFWSATPNNVMNKESGCPVCADHSLTKEMVNDRIVSRGLTMIGDYVDSRTKSEFKCDLGHTWKATPAHVLHGTGCPSCAEYGFNPTIPAWEYAFTRDGYLKFGITNDLIRRLNEHRKHGEITVVHEQYHEVGKVALDWENNIKRTLGGKYATKEQCPDGYTETLCSSKLKDLITMINK